MTTYQATLYKAEYIDEELGWDIGELMFKSSVTGDPSVAMQELDFYDPVYPNWFAIMKIMEDGVVVENEWFDCSVVDVEY